MCLDLLNPFKICQFVSYVIGAFILIFIGGYVGKGIYLHVNKGDERLVDVLVDDEFWVPDGDFWVFGIAFFVLFFLALALLRIILILLWMGFYRLSRWLCCVCYRTDDLEKGYKKYKKLENVQ